MTTMEHLETPTDTGPSPADQLCERLFGASMGMVDVMSVYLGDRLGLYAALEAAGEANSGKLAVSTGFNERYLREWLAHQAATGILVSTTSSKDDSARSYKLNPYYHPVVLEKDDPVYMVGLIRTLVSLGRKIDDVAAVMQNGGGIPYADYGPDMIEGQELTTRPGFSASLTSAWLPAIPEVHNLLMSGKSLRLADVACGGAWSSIALARAYPNVTIEAVDSDPTSVANARQNVAEAGLEGRIEVRLGDGADLVGPFDIVTIFEAVHDMSQPVSVLRGVRSALAPGGLVLIADENVGDEFVAPAENPFETFFYGAGLFICLPSGMADEPSVATGAVLRPAALQKYTAEAGFTRFSAAEVDYPFWRFYVIGD
jgi:2-polyprenyl-3-methyl-5-hydroxy-6-metoxy-1,4-benzoquinol methylase